MTNVLPLFDASCSTASGLLPLDFSLLQNSDPATSSFLLSPLCSVATLRSPLVADPFLKSPLPSTLPISPFTCTASPFSYLQTPWYPTKQAQNPTQRAASPKLHIPSPPAELCTASPTSPLTPDAIDSLMTDEAHSPSATTALTAPPQPASPLSAAPATTPQTTSSTVSTRKNEMPATDSTSSIALKPTSAIDKAAERRRKNRESSSRCYYNRKRVIQKLETQLVAEKDKLTKLYDRALQLRHDNARLKKEVVTNGYALPPSRTKHASSKTINSFSLRDYLRLLHNSTYQNPSHSL